MTSTDDRRLRFAVIGHPVAHSRSPAMHGAAYRALDLPHVYEKIDTTADDLPHRIAELRHHDLDGLNVTVPHKQAVMALVDEIARSAQAIGAANTVVRTPSGRLVAHNTDAPALAEEIATLHGGALEGGSAIVIGSGGAARAAIFALASLGLERIHVRSRRPIADAAAIAGSRTVVAEALGAPPLERSDLVAIVQCTTAGMHAGAPGHVSVDAVHWPSVPASCVAYDVVYSPETTPFLEAAATHGLAHANGLGMLVAQGALAFQLWLGVAPPRDVMRAALSDAK